MKFPHKRFDALERVGEHSNETPENPELVETEQARLALARQLAARLAEKLQVKFEKGAHTLVPALGEGVLVARAARGVHEITGEGLNRYERVVDVLNAVASATMWTCLMLGKYDKAAVAKGAVLSLTWVEPALREAAYYAKELGGHLGDVLERIASSTPLVRNMVGIFDQDDIEAYEAE